MPTLRQHVPAFMETDEPRKTAWVNSPADLEHVAWVHRWTEAFNGHVFDHWAQSQRLLIAVYDRGAYWWVVGRLSEPLPELREWAGPPRGITQ